MTSTDLDNFLQETEFCDFNNLEICKINQEITKKDTSREERAISLFLWVRDNIPYKFGSWSKKASEVLAQRSGMCTNKAVLLVSFFRLNKIPSGFGCLKVKGQEYFGTIAIPILSKLVSKRSVHVYVYVFLNNAWQRIDPSGDIDLSKKTSYFNKTTEIVEWNGKGDAMENLDPETIISDSGLIVNIEDKLNKKPPFGKGIIFKIGNIYLEFLRKNNTAINNPKDLQLLFLNWLKKKSFSFYLLIKAASLIVDLKSYIRNEEK